jgi:hypothetical protein
VESALAAVTSKYGEQHKTVRILLHPATYILKEPLVVRACGLAEVTIETIDISKSNCSSTIEASLHTMAGGLSGHSSETFRLEIAGYLQARNFQSVLGLWVAA